MDNKILHELMRMNCNLADIRGAINKNKKNEFHIEIQFSKDQGEFACEFLKLLFTAKESGSPIEFLKNCFTSKGKSLYEVLSEMGCDIEEMFSKLENL